MILLHFLFFAIFDPIWGTIDLNLAELQYLSDHLQPEECKKLVAAAHFVQYDKPESLDLAEKQIPDDIPCLILIEHWNSIEGKGETHEILERRLRQIGRVDLADWLGKTVFKEIGKDLQETLSEGFGDVLTTNETFIVTKSNVTIAPPLDENPDPTDEWLPIDTVAFVVLSLLIGLLIFICLRAFFVCACRRRRRPKSSKGPGTPAESYQLMENEASYSDEDGKMRMKEDKF